jgi:hypothetical protein
VSPAKAVFFSMVACLRNLGAFTVYGLAWSVVFTLSAMTVISALAVVGLISAAQLMMVPLALTMASMLFTSIYFTFCDSFDLTDPTDAAATSANDTNEPPLN